MTKIRNESISKNEKTVSEESKKIVSECIKNGELRVVDIDSIDNWKDNPRKFTKENIKELAEVLEIHGQISPVVVWREDNQIRKGNRTRLAMKSIGSKKILCLFVDFPNESMANAYGLSDNKLSESGKWDNELLQKMLVNVDKSNINFKCTGFNEIEIVSFLLKNRIEKNEIEKNEINKEVVKKFKDYNILLTFNVEEDYNLFLSIFKLNKDKVNGVIDFSLIKKYLI